MELEVSDEEAEEQHAQTARQPPQRHHSSVAAVGRGTSRPLCEWRQGAGRGSRAPSPLTVISWYFNTGTCTNLDLASTVDACTGYIVLIYIVLGRSTDYYLVLDEYRSTSS